MIALQCWINESAEVKWWILWPRWLNTSLLQTQPLQQKCVILIQEVSQLIWGVVQSWDCFLGILTVGSNIEQWLPWKLALVSSLWQYHVKWYFIPSLLSSGEAPFVSLSSSPHWRSFITPEPTTEEWNNPFSANEQFIEWISKASFWLL